MAAISAATADVDSYFFDTVTITAVPEPSTMAIFASMAALGLVMRRQRV